jgi:hypothetical protein
MLEGRYAGTLCRINPPHLIVCQESPAGRREWQAEILGQLRVLMLKQYVLAMLSLIEIVKSRARLVF